MLTLALGWWDRGAARLGAPATSAASSPLRAQVNASGAPAANISPCWMKARRLKDFVFIRPVKYSSGCSLYFAPNLPAVKCDPWGREMPSAPSGEPLP